MTTLGAIVVVLLGAARGAAPVVDVSVEPPVVPYHLQSTFTITVEVDAGSDVTIDSMVEKFGGLSVYGDPAYGEELIGDGRRRVTQRYTIDPVFVGEYAIAPVRVIVDEYPPIIVPSPGLRVRDLTDEETQAAMQFAPNAGPVSLDAPWYRSWALWVAAGVAVAVAAAAFGWVYWRRRRPQGVEVRLSSWELAYRRLRRLDTNHWPEAGKYEPYYVELSGILRRYVEDRFTLHAPERTTQEFLVEAANSHVLNEDQQRRVAGFLRHCDRVKFAQYVPTKKEMEQSMADVLEFIDESIPAQAPQEDAA